MLDDSAKVTEHSRTLYTIHEYRADGWPLCPCCVEDELYSLLQWNGDGERPPLAAYIAAGLRCYYCGWSKKKY